MTRRMFLWMMAAAGFVLRSGGSTLSAQDVQYARAMDRAQKDRPSRLGANARIAPTSEPGDPVIVRGRLRNVDGAAAAGTIVFAYQTDRGGLYDDRSRGPHSWRLRGWARTDRDGRFTFETIRPGAYPGGSIPPHFHFTAFLPNGERYHTPQINLAATRLGNARGPEEVTAELRLEARSRF
ncbi:MAG TPA: hypothetical protein VF701_20850 [Thermoanaerobaculia bacterium]